MKKGLETYRSYRYIEWKTIIVVFARMSTLDLLADCFN